MLILTATLNLAVSFPSTGRAPHHPLETDTGGNEAGDVASRLGTDFVEEILLNTFREKSFCFRCNGGWMFSVGVCSAILRMWRLFSRVR